MAPKIVNIPLKKELLNLSELVIQLGHDSAVLGYTGPGTTWADEMNICYEPCPIDLLTCSPMCNHCATAAPCLDTINSNSVRSDFVITRSLLYNTNNICYSFMIIVYVWHRCPGTDTRVNGVS